MRSDTDFLTKISTQGISKGILFFSWLIVALAWAGVLSLLQMEQIVVLDTPEKTQLKDEIVFLSWAALGMCTAVCFGLIGLLGKPSGNKRVAAVFRIVMAAGPAIAVTLLAMSLIYNRFVGST